MAFDNVQAFLATPPNAVDFAELEKTLRSLDTRLVEEERELAAKREAVERLREDRDALRGYRNFVVHFGGFRSTTPSNGSGSTPNKRAAIRELLANGEAWTTPEIRQALIEQGAMEDSEAQAHTLQVTLSRLFRRGELDRVRQGTYKLSAPASTEVVEA